MVLGDGSETMTVHPNDMTKWEEIGCKLDHRHDTRNVEVDLSHPHGYHDYPQLPSDLAVRFNMDIWDWRQYTTVTNYCPAHDAVSETIDTLGIWEPVETILALQVFSTAGEDAQFIDLGSQIGWFSHLAQAMDVEPVGFDADNDCVQLLRRQFFSATQLRFGVEKVPQITVDARLMKMDLEGAEGAAIDAFWPSISSGKVDHILMEVSPCFNNSYPDLLRLVVDQGYELYSLPPKRIPPHDLYDPATHLTHIPRNTISAFVDSFDQADCWLKHENAAW